MSTFDKATQQLKRNINRTQTIANNGTNEALYATGLLMARYAFSEGESYKKRLANFEATMTSLVPLNRRQFLKEQDNKIEFQQTLKLLLVRENLISAYDVLDTNIEEWIKSKTNNNTQKSQKIKKLISDAEYLCRQSEI